MTGYIARRLLQLLPVLLLASLGIWGMIYAVPGNPVASIVGENATAEQIRDVTERLGLDRPILVQYWSWLTSVLRGDLGASLHSRDPVLHLIMQRVPATIQLAIAATIVGLVLGIPVAIASAVAPNSWLDRALSGSTKRHLVVSEERRHGVRKPAALIRDINRNGAIRGTPRPRNRIGPLIETERDLLAIDQRQVSPRALVIRLLRHHRLERVAQARMLVGGEVLKVQRKAQLWRCSRCRIGGHHRADQLTAGVGNRCRDAIRHIVEDLERTVGDVAIEVLRPYLQAGGQVDQSRAHAQRAATRAHLAFNGVARTHRRRMRFDRRR